MATLPDGRRLDQIAASQHDRQCAGDYRRLREAGLLTVREAVRWPLVDRGGQLDLSSLAPMVQALRWAKLAVIWDLFHYGFPSDVNLFSHGFPPRFAAYCRGVAEFLANELPAPRFYTPINEISYFSHAAGQVAYFAPFARRRGRRLKRQLVRATLAAIEAIRDADPSARFLHVDPLVHLVPPAEAPELAPEVENFNTEVVYEAWLMLAGRKEPELGGREEALDIAGANLYPRCQWEYARRNRFLKPGDPRWLPLRELLHQAWARLRCPILITETGANGPERPGWLRYLFDEVQAARAAGVPVLGLCWYPVVSCPDWHDPTSIFPAGLWDLVPTGRRLRRVPSVPALAALQEAQRKLSQSGERETPPGSGSPGQGRNGAEVSGNGKISLSAPVSSGPALSVTRLRRVSAGEACRFSPENFGWASLLAGEGLAISSYCLQAGQEVSARQYAREETALCVLEGEVQVFDWQASVPLQQREVMLVPAGTPFGLRNEGSGACRVLQIAAPRPWNADSHGHEPPNAVLPESGDDEPPRRRSG